jgi:hypothetical protein
VAKRKQAEDPQGSDFGTVEARRQAFHIVEQPDPGDRSTRRVRVEQDMVEWYLRRQYITVTQADALKKWQADAYLAGLMPACIGGYGQTVNGGTTEFSDMRVAAIARRANAIIFLTNLSKYAVPMVDAVAINGKSAGRWIMEHVGGSPHEALVWLKRFTDALARHYGLAR